MKKLFFLIAAAITFASCGNDNTMDDAVDDDTTYSVTFSIDPFSVQTNPLKTASDLSDGNYFQYVIYKEDGSVLLDKILDEGTFDMENLKISIDLSKGNYHLAALSAKRTTFNSSIYTPSNYETDYCNGNQWIVKGFDNYNIYFETVDFSVNNQTVEKSVVLQPMWTEIDIQALDADICTLPAETKYVQTAVYPYYYGFSIKDKKATRYKDPAVSASALLFKSVEKFREDKGYFGYPVAASNNITVKLLYITASESVAQENLGEKTIYTGDIERGKRITFSGKLGEHEVNSKFSFSLKDLEDGGTIPY